MNIMINFRKIRPMLLVTVVVAVALIGVYALWGGRGGKTDTWLWSRAGGVRSARGIDPADFQKAMRELWTDHMQYTYATVNAFFHNPPAVQAHLNRLLRNQREIGAAFATFYGRGVGDQLAGLLTTHIEQAVPVLQAAQAGDSAALQAALDDWYANAAEIAEFLSSLNRQHWPSSLMQNIWRVHIDQTTTYSTDVLRGDYEAAIQHYDEAFDHLMGLSDLLSAGIIAQFPQKFAE